MKKEFIKGKWYKYIYNKGYFTYYAKFKDVQDNKFQASEHIRLNNLGVFAEYNPKGSQYLFLVNEEKAIECSIEEFKQWLPKDHPDLIEKFVLPEFWCIKRNKENYKVINEWMNKHHNTDPGDRDYSAEEGHVNNKNLHKGTGAEGLPEITFEQFKEHVLKEKEDIFILPKQWCIISPSREYDGVINEYARNTGGAWWIDENNYAQKYYLHILNGSYLRGNSIPAKGYTPITIEQFFSHVLKQETMKQLPEKWSVKNDGSQLFKDRVISYLKKQYNDTYQGDSQNAYYGYNGKYTFASNTDESTTVLTLTEFINITEMKEKKILGWKLKDQKYAAASQQIVAYGINNEVDFKDGSYAHSQMKEAGVLDLWFSPVYKEDKVEWKVGDYAYVYKLQEDGGGNNRKAVIGEVFKISHVGQDWLNGAGSGTGLGVRIENCRKATQAEIEAATQETINMGSFNLLVKGGKCFHNSKDITRFVKDMMNNFGVTFRDQENLEFGGYYATVSEITFSQTGCQSNKTTLTQWREVYKKMQECRG